LFTPVDAPAVAAATIEALIARWRSRVPGELIFRPRCEGRRGHPVLVTARIAAELVALPIAASARDVIHGHLAASVFVDVKDRGILADIDRPEDYAALAAQTELIP
jgi:molybdenum cofactor cytidylyltransferase